MGMPYLGPITQAMFEVDDPPSIIREWLSNLRADDNYVFLWAAATKSLSWTCVQTALGEGEEEPNAVISTPAGNVERLLAPVAHEGRVRILQALFDGPLTPTELTARTGFQGGGLHHHLRELKYGEYVTSEKGRYKLTPFGRQVLMTVTLIASVAVADRGEEGLAVGANWAQAVPGEEEGMSAELKAALKRLAHEVEEAELAAGEGAGVLVEIEEVLGTSKRVAQGETFMVRGRYVQDGERAAWLRLSAVGTSRGKQIRIRTGSGEFESTAEVLAVREGREDVLDLTVADEKGAMLGVCARIRLKGE